MKLGKIKYLLVALAMVATGVVVYYSHDTIKKLGNNITTNTPDKIDPAFADYISAFTSGYISTHSSIKIKFNKELSGSTQLNTPIKENYFSFEPALEGITVWKDAQTIEFTPSKPMEQDKEYKATFHLGDLIEVKKELREFEFQFQTIRQSLQLQANHLKSYNSADFSYYSLTGTLSSADVAKNDAIEKTLNAELNGKNLNIKWQHDEAGISHRFTIDSIERPATGSASLQLNCNGKTMEVDYQSKMDYEVPAKEEYKVLYVQVVPEEQVCIQVNFSNPIDATQSLEGLINIGSLKEIKYIVNCNQVLVYPGTAAAGSYILRIEAGVKDAKGRQLEKASEHSIVFDELKPAVRFMGNGNILPSTSGLTVPFETVNLKAVDVTIIKIYENNVLQFLQNNSLDGSSQISQVGKKIVQKRINLGLKNPADFRVWKKFSLDLSSLFKAEQGAIYRVIIRFKKSYSTYSCLGNSFDDKFEMEEVQAQPDEDEISYFNYYSDEYAGNYYENDENEDYSYEDRDNPCKGYYYQRYERVVSRNIIASDLGISLKKGSNGNIFVAANDLLSTKPLADVEVEFYDYQKQRIQR
ncbi:MAG: hypothetical protein IT236_17865, partial [Bacteroidia bacterium]|nr:hypothetical protein [Bacteroidia bacterium]